MQLSGAPGMEPTCLRQQLWKARTALKLEYNSKMVIRMFSPAPLSRTNSSTDSRRQLSGELPDCHCTKVTSSGMSISLTADRRIAAAAFGAGFGVCVHAGRDPAAKSSCPPALLESGHMHRAEHKPRAGVKAITTLLEEAMEKQDWKSLLSMEVQAIKVAKALRRTSPADAAVIYGNLGHAHIQTFQIPVAIYADHGKLVTLFLELAMEREFAELFALML